MSQKGFTLVELMVGLVIAMLCMLMMLMLFKQTTQIGISSSRDSEYDAQIRTALSVAQKLVQNAGYGSGKTSDIAVGVDTQNVPAVFWRMNPDPVTSLMSANTTINYNCEALTQEKEGDTYRLIFLKKNNCGSEAVLNIETFSQPDEKQHIVSFKTLETGTVFNFVLTPGNCTPFGIDKNNSKGTRQLTITANRQYADEMQNSNIGQTVSNTVCLNNIVNL